MESMIEHSMSDEKVSDYNFLNYLQHPIYIKKVKLYQLYEFPFLTDEQAENILTWSRTHRFISAQSFKSYLQNDELYEALRPFITFEKTGQLLFSNQFYANSRDSRNNKTKIFTKYRQHEFYIRNIHYRDYPDKQFWDYNWENDFSQIRMGHFSVKTPLKLLGGSSSFGNRTHFHDDAVFGSRPSFKTNSAFSQLTGIAGMIYSLNRQLTVYASENSLAVHTDADRVLDFYANPFTEIKEDEDSRYLKYQTWGASLWQNINNHLAVNFSLTRQKPIKNKLADPQFSPLLYQSAYTGFNSVFSGMGIYQYYPGYQNEAEILASKGGKYSLIIKQAFKPADKWMFEFVYFNYSAEIYYLQSRTYVSFDDVAHNYKGFLFRNNIQYYTGKMKHRWELYAFSGEQIIPSNMDDYLLIRNKMFITYQINLKSMHFRGKYRKYKITENSLPRHQHVLDFLFKFKMKGGSYVNFSNKTAFRSYPDRMLNTSGGSRFHYKGSYPLGFDMSWQIFHIKSNDFAFYEDELSYLPGIEWLRLTRNGFKLSMILKWSGENYATGIKFRRIWKDENGLLKPASYFWWYLELYQKS